MQPDGMMGRHWDGEHNPLERLQASEEADEVVADDTSHVNQGGDLFFQTEVEMDLETSQVADRHFELAMFPQ